MAPAYQVLPLLLVLTVAVLGERSSIELQITETHVKPGHEVTLTCRVRGEVQEAVYFGKGFVKDDGDFHMDPLSSQTALLFKNPRYELSMIPVGDVKLYNLVISNVTYQDSGIFRCATAEGTSDTRGIVELFVYHPVGELSFNNFTAGQKVRVNERTELDLVCTASGSIPAANVRVTLGSEDITGKFSKSTHSTPHCTEGEVTSRECLVHQTHAITAAMPGFKPKWTDNMKRLSCMANVENSGFDAREVSFQLEVHYPPKFIAGKCHSIVTVRLLESYEISCTVSSNPSNPEFYWSFMWDGNEMRLFNDEGTSDGEFQAIQQMNNDGTINAKLHIKNLSSKHLIRYHLNANNTLGSNETTIKLQEDPRYRISLPPDNSYTNGAPSPSVVTVMLLPILFLLTSLL